MTAPLRADTRALASRLRPSAGVELELGDEQGRASLSMLDLLPLVLGARGWRVGDRWRGEARLGVSSALRLVGRCQAGEERWPIADSRPIA